MSSSIIFIIFIYFNGEGRMKKEEEEVRKKVTAF